MKTTANPIYAADLFQVRTFRLGLTGNLFSRLGISSIPFLLPLLFHKKSRVRLCRQRIRLAGRTRRFRIACRQTAHQP